MAFECEHCSFRNSEVQMGGMIPDKGVRFQLTVAKGDMKARPPAAVGCRDCACAPAADALGVLRLPPACSRCLGRLLRATPPPSRCGVRPRRAPKCPMPLAACAVLTRRRANAVQIPELELEIPSLTQRGTMTTVRRAAQPCVGVARGRVMHLHLTCGPQVEGVLSNTARDLRLLQAERGAADPELAGALRRRSAASRVP